MFWGLVFEVFGVEGYGFRLLGFKVLVPPIAENKGSINNPYAPPPPPSPNPYMPQAQPVQHVQYSEGVQQALRMGFGIK